MPASPGPDSQLRVLIKLGGAALTHKQQLETLNGEVLAAAAAQLAALYAAIGPRFVVVHGAGSFGHQAAAAAGVAHGGLHASPAVRQGFAATRASVCFLNRLVVDALLGAGLPAVGVSPCPSWTTCGGGARVASDGCAGVAALLAAGLVPVLHGDAVLDEVQGCSILSGDVIISSLCRAFRPPVVAFLVRHAAAAAAACLLRPAARSPGCRKACLRAAPHYSYGCACPPSLQTNVDGIYDRPPEQPGAQLIARLVVEQAGSSGSSSAGSDTDDGGSVAAASSSGSGLPCGARAFTRQGAPVQSLETSAAAHDTTGGVRTKIREAAAVARLGAEVRIAQAGSAAAAAACDPASLPPGWLGTVVHCT